MGAPPQCAPRPAIAVFDVDETLIRVKSMFGFLTFALEQRKGTDAGRRDAQEIVAGLRQMAQHMPRNAVNRAFYRHFRNWPEAEIRDLAAAWFASVNCDGLYHPEVLARFREHQRLGHETVLLSGSAKLFLAPLALFLGADLLLAIRLEVAEDGLLTGEITGTQTIGEGKRDALNALLTASGAGAVLHGYGDHVSDRPFLELCDHRTVVLSDRRARALDWPEDYERLAVSH
jgi:HAD superfamily hydrolase (TIGR01490 family)